VNRQNFLQIKPRPYPTYGNRQIPLPKQQLQQEARKHQHRHWHVPCSGCAHRTLQTIRNAIFQFDFNRNNPAAGTACPSATVQDEPSSAIPRVVRHIRYRLRRPHLASARALRDCLASATTAAAPSRPPDGAAARPAAARLKGPCLILLIE